MVVHLSKSMILVLFVDTIVISMLSTQGVHFWKVMHQTWFGHPFFFGDSTVDLWCMAIGRFLILLPLTLYAWLDTCRAARLHGEGETYHMVNSTDSEANDEQLIAGRAPSTPLRSRKSPTDSPLSPSLGSPWTHRANKVEMVACSRMVIHILRCVAMRTMKRVHRR